jgi:hypothetical protein
MAGGDHRRLHACRDRVSHALGTEYGRYDVIKTIENALTPHCPRTFTIPGLTYGPHDGFPSGKMPELGYVSWEWIRLDNAKANLADETMTALCEFVGCLANAGPKHSPDERPYTIELVVHIVARQDVGRSVSHGFQVLPAVRRSRIPQCAASARGGSSLRGPSAKTPDAMSTMPPGESVHHQRQRHRSAIPLRLVSFTFLLWAPSCPFDYAGDATAGPPCDPGANASTTWQ